MQRLDCHRSSPRVRLPFAVTEGRGNSERRSVHVPFGAPECAIGGIETAETQIVVPHQRFQVRNRLFQRNPRGVLQIGNGASVPFRPHSIMVVPARSRQSLGEASPIRGETPADENCEMIADGILKFTAGEGSASTRVLCGMILATYGGTLGLFDHLSEAIVEDAGHSEPLRHAFAEMIGELAKPGVGTRALTEALMKQCLILLLRQHLVHHSVDSPFFSALQDRRLARAVAAILERPAETHTVDGLAQLAGMSRSAFTERFAEVFGQSPIDFLTKVRLRLAAHLLTTTDLPIKLVAKSIGYASRSYFSRAFRATYGHDPATFRSFGTSPQDEPWADKAAPVGSG